MRQHRAATGANGIPAGAGRRDGKQVHMAGDRPTPPVATTLRGLPAPLVEFLHLEAAGGIVLVAATAVALIWANSPWQDSYITFWSTPLDITLGSHSLDLTLQGWVNDGLMAIFFLVVGLEIKRELVEGELNDPRRAALPAVAAVGGMLVPALVYIAINVGGDGARGWGIPMATDIAMAVGVLSLLGSRVSSSLKLFLLALAIVDDIGAIAVIAIFYSGDIHLDAVAAAAVIVVGVAVLRRLGVRPIPVYVALGCALWLALHEAGLHATIAGVVMGLMAPTSPMRRREDVSDDKLRDVSTPETARETVVLARESVSVVAWLEHLLHPWTSFVIVPVFALANAGVILSASALADAATSRVTYGVAAGLVVGKLAGVSLFAWLAVRLGIGALPDGVGWRGIVSVAAVAGIGFTVSIFVTGLAFDDADLRDQAKIGILAASLAAGLLGAFLLRRLARPQSVR
jgi:Na+:H+ antiporter, NhaA family